MSSLLEAYKSVIFLEEGIIDKGKAALTKGAELGGELVGKFADKMAERTGHVTGNFVKGNISGAGLKNINKTVGEVDELVGKGNEFLKQHGKKLAIGASALGAAGVGAAGLKLGRGAINIGRNLDKCFRTCRGSGKNDSLANVCMINCRIQAYKDKLKNIQAAGTNVKDKKKFLAKYNEEAEKIRNKILELEKKKNYYKP